MKKINIIILALILLGGCAAGTQNYAITSSSIAVEAATLTRQYEKVETILRQVQTDTNMFDDAEWRKLLNVDATIDMLVSKYDAISKFDNPTMNIADVELMWGMTVEGYRQAREVLMAHWSEFQPSTQLLLNSFDAKAEMTSDRINDLISNPSNENVNETLTLMAGVLSIAVKMLGAAVL